MEGREPGSAKRDWHLDRRVPITILIVVAVNLASGIWFAAKLDARVLAVEKDQASQAHRDRQQDENMRDAIALLRGQLDRIEGNLYRLLERSGGNGGAAR